MSDNATDTRTLIHLDGVGKTYPGTSVPAVAELNLDIREGEILVLVGPSGCGKSTTLRLINRMIEPSSGRIIFDGEDVTTVNPDLLRRRIGYVIQQVGLFPHQTIRRNIAAVPELLGWDKRRIAERCDELVELVGLDSALLDRYPAELSGGQQQRVGVARALAADPPLLLMDEPYSAVDPIVRTRLQDELLALQERVRKTIVFVTHDVDEAIRLADRVAVLNVGGVLAQYAAPAELLAAPASEFVARFLGRERGLRRLALMRVADVDHVAGPVVAASDPADAARAAADRFGSIWFAVVDHGVLRGWADVGALDTAGAAGDVELRPFAATVGPGTALREALDVIVTSHSRVAAVVDDDGCYLGMITVDQVAGGLQP